MPSCLRPHRARGKFLQLFDELRMPAELRLSAIRVFVAQANPALKKYRGSGSAYVDRGATLESPAEAPEPNASTEALVSLLTAILGIKPCSLDRFAPV